MHKWLMIVFFGVQQASAQSTVANTGSSIKARDAELILKHHNTIRKEKGEVALTWSTTLAAYAQQWADHLAKNNHCEIMHREVCGQNGQTYGENIFWGSSAVAYPPVEASYNWYEEKKAYRYRKISGSSGYNTGHYTQMIWKDTQQMGVGVTICPNGAIIVVANYYPAGNVIGQYPY
jgi:pathogenesis-related protein 1